jgi:hypothetical protein
MSETIKNDVALEVVTLEKPYTFRKLGAEDVFLMVSIISKIGIKEFKTFFEGGDFKNILSKFTEEAREKADETDEASVTALGASIFLELATTVICNLPKAENEIFQMLSNTSNLSVKEVRKLGLADFTEMIVDFFKKDEFKDFIKVVSKLFK